MRWKYKKSLLNLYNTSESNILSVANNQRILHDFLFSRDVEFCNLSIEERPKTYFPHRTKLDLEYYVCDEYVKLEQVQVEIDLTIEYKGYVAVFEAKNGNPKSFSIYQLYHPYLYYVKAKREGIDIKDITAVYLVKTKRRNNIELKLYAYKFKDEKRMNSIYLEKAKKYILEFS